MKILCIEDDKETAEYIARGFKERGHIADIAKDGHEGLFLARDGDYNVIILDRMLPYLDGLSLLKLLRSSQITTPIIFLTALGSLEDRVNGLELGSDDYLVKPFAFSELYARVNSLARRPPMNKEAVETKLQCGDLEIDLLDRSVTRSGQSIELQPTEFRLLEYLMRNAGRIVTKTMLLETVWDFHFDPKTNVVETHISRLRAKVDRGFKEEIIKTIRGSGYKIDV